MNKRLAGAGFALVLLALAVGSGAIGSGDELTNSDTDGTVYFAPDNSSTGGSYAEFDDGKITLVVDRLNPDAETVIDDVFKVGYDGRGTAEVWIKDGSDRVTFYDETRAPIENGTEDEKLFLQQNDTESVGVEIDSGRSSEIIDEITLVAILPTAEDLVVSSPGTGTPPESNGGTALPDVGSPEVVSEDAGADRSRLRVDLGGMEVQFREPKFAYTADVSRKEVGVGASGIEGIATVIQDDSPSTQETIVVGSNVENTGEASGTTVAELRINGRVIETRTVELNPGENTTVDFVVSFDEPGLYDVVVGNSEPVTVTVTQEGVSLYPWAPLVGLLSLFALFMIYRRRREEEETE